MIERTVFLRQPMVHQRPVLLSRARHKLLLCGRRWGKSSLALIAAVSGHGPARGYFPGAVEGAHVAWVVPAYPSVVETWRDLKNSLRGAWVDKSEQEHRIELLGGGVVLVRSGEDPDSLRGFKFQGAVVDETASQREELWAHALAPALSDSRGWSLFAGTPKGPSNWFSKLYLEAGALTGWARYQRPSSDNPLLTPDELAARRRELGEFAFAREFLALIASPEGGMFKREWARFYDVREGRLVVGQEEVRRENLTVFVAADLATSAKSYSDFSAMLVTGRARDGRLFLLDMLHRKLEGPAVVPTLRRLMDKWNATVLVLERAGPLVALNQEAKAQGLSVHEIPLVRGVDKVGRATPAAAALESGRILLPRGAAWVEPFLDELCNFPSVGSHDDQVDAVSVAVAAAPPPAPPVPLAEEHSSVVRDALDAHYRPGWWTGTREGAW